MNIEQIMTRKVVTVELDTSLETVNKLFGLSRFHHLLVVDQGCLVGIISDRDLFKALSPNLGQNLASSHDLATLKKRAHQIMSRKLITLSVDASLKQVAETFVEQRVSCIPIVNAGMEVQGIVSWRDLLKYLLSLNH